MIPLLLVFAALASQESPEVFTLNTQWNVWDVAAEDMNADAHADLFLLSCDNEGNPLKKALATFIASNTGSYTSTPTFATPLPESTSVLFFAEVDGAVPRELIAADAAGAWIYRYDGERLVEDRRVELSSLFPHAAREPVFLEDSTVVLGEGGQEAWAIPVPSGYELRNADGRLALLPCDMVSEIRRNGSTYITHRLPSVHPFKLPGSEVQALAFLSDEYADFSFGTEWSESRRFRIPQDLEEKWEAASKMADVNGDGLPDLLVSQTRGTVNIEAKTQVYLATEPFKYPSTPTATFDSKGALASPSLVDVDGDGKLDVVIVSIPFGIKNLVNYFVRGKLSVDAEVYAFNGTDFGQKPAYSSALTMEAPEGRERVAYVFDDFDGDGRRDAAYGQGPETLVVHRGVPGSFVEKSAWQTLEVPAFGTARAYDLNNAGGKDIVIFHTGGSNGTRVEVILF